MASGFAKPITIKEAIDKIDDRSYLLPAIQRKFVWSSDQIEVLFDSIMRGYPINSFMFWDVTSNEVKNSFKFYQFLLEYRQFFKEDNPDIGTAGYKDFIAVIDGQQRLTSLYIGLKGSYAYKLPRKWLVDSQDAMPTRHLYLNISKPLPEDNERLMEYDFQFLTSTEIRKINSKGDAIFFKVSDILNFETQDQLDDHIDENGWLTEKFTKNTIRKLFSVVNSEPLINYYLEETQEIDKVLDIFIRTNSGGEPLSFSNLLMSITTANWSADARKEIPSLVKDVYKYGRPNFLVNEDWVLKTCLVLFNDSIKFQVKNFDRSSVKVFELNWDRIKKCVVESFKLLEQLGYNNQSLRAKNAVIPIVYYVFHRGIETDLNNPTRYIQEKQNIRKWLNISLIKGVFGGQGDNVLSVIRKAIKAELKDNPVNPQFPLNRIKDEFKSNPSKSLSFDDEFIDGLLTIQKDAHDCYPVLSLIYSHLNFEHQVFHKDHLHPASYFRKLKSGDFATKEEFEYYADTANWNGIVNLQLLNGAMNQSKLDSQLQDWVRQHKIDLDNQLIPKHISLDIKGFQGFINARKTLLKNRLVQVLT